MTIPPDSAFAVTLGGSRPRAATEFGGFLVAEGLIVAKDLERVEAARNGVYTPLHVALSGLGVLKEEALTGALARFLGLPLFSREDCPPAPIAPEKFGREFLRSKRLLPFAEKDGDLWVALADPTDADLIGAIEFHLERAIKVAVASPSDIDGAIAALYAEPEAALPDAAVSEDDVEALKSLATEQPVIRYVNKIVDDAVRRSASDIHLEPEETILKLRYRVDGVLLDADGAPRTMAPAVVSRIKIMAKLDIAERRLPQDGRIQLSVRGSPIDLRVSTMPTLRGENVVMRVLDRSAMNFEFVELGFSPQALTQFLGLLSRPNGVTLVTGPTGSGKTTTLYASMKSLNDGKRKIFSVEDPVEYLLAGVNQIAVESKIGLDFARALRSILRQDPDIIMIGEIRDSETAEIAIQAALTGHLVLATLHTNTAAAAISRLLDMGAEDYLLTSAITGIAAQRLVRRLCDRCAVANPSATALIRQLARGAPLDASSEAPRKAVGCAACFNTGYKGRLGVIEVLTMSPALRELIQDKADDRRLEEAAIMGGMKPMLVAGLEAALRGETTAEEILRSMRLN